MPTFFKVFLALFVVVATFIIFNIGFYAAGYFNIIPNKYADGIVVAKTITPDCDKNGCNNDYNIMITSNEVAKEYGNLTATQNISYGIPAHWAPYYVGEHVKFRYTNIPFTHFVQFIDIVN